MPEETNVEAIVKRLYMYESILAALVRSSPDKTLKVPIVEVTIFPGEALMIGKADENTVMISLGRIVMETVDARVGNVLSPKVVPVEEP